MNCAKGDILFLVDHVTCCVHVVSESQDIIGQVSLIISDYPASLVIMDLSKRRYLVYNLSRELT